MRKLGIIGGMSWSSTALYYDHINREVSRRLGGLHCAWIGLESLDFDGIAAKEASGDWDGIAAELIEAGRNLEVGGAEAIVIACNTVHKCFGLVAASLGVPMFHIADATADRLVADKRKRVALLGTRFTMTESFFRSRLEARGIALAPIEQVWIDEVDQIIFEELARGQIVRNSQRKLKTLITELAKQRVEAVVLGCTELVLAVDARANVLPVYDTTEIHASACVEWMLAEEEVARAAA